MTRMAQGFIRAICVIRGESGAAQIAVSRPTADLTPFPAPVIIPGDSEISHLG
jgi:hypothetical protein